MRKIFATMAAVAALTAAGALTAQAQEKKLLWGDTHLHTNYSPDAYFFLNKTADPDTAYRWAKGLPVIHPYHRARIQIGTPLDFLVVSDHAEYMGVPLKLFAGDATLAESPTGKRFIQMAKEGKGRDVVFEIVASANRATAIKDLDSPKVRATNWSEIVAAAERHNEPGKFTAFIGWEWSSIPDGANLHRVVFMPQGASVAGKFVPFSLFDSEKPEDLWNWLEKTEKETGAEFVAIPHNSNISGGLMFPEADSDGRPVTAAYARTRMKWEPVVEVTQIKGDSETHPSLSPNDEFADFETYAHAIKTTGGSTDVEIAPGDYVRSALKRGLQIEASAGVNPYKFGVIGSTDAHTAMASAEENNFWGKLAVDSVPENKAKELLPGAKGRDMSASGLAAVWAEDNTREAITAAFKRKEVYATSGPRIGVRVFGGWDFKPDDAQVRDLAGIGYEKGVPMGGDLTSAPAGKAPSFLVHAVKDPKDANLDRIQVVKGWTKNGQTFEKIYNVALADGRTVGTNGKAPPVGNTVNLKTARYRNTIGDPQLTAVWTDPDFDPQARAFYYVRALQIPTPRHSLYDAVALGVAHPKERPPTIQERAYTSPIWYTPSGEALAKAKEAAITVDELTGRGLDPLDDAGLKALAVGKTLTIRNRVTGELYEATYGADGRRSLRNLSEAQVRLAGMQAVHGGPAGDGIAPYEIRDGRVMTTFGGQTFEAIVFNVDGKYLAARSDEGGHLNYEIVSSK